MQTTENKFLNSSSCNGNVNIQTNHATFDLRANKFHNNRSKNVLLFAIPFVRSIHMLHTTQNVCNIEKQNFIDISDVKEVNRVFSITNFADCLFHKGFPIPNICPVAVIKLDQDAL